MSTKDRPTTTGDKPIQRQDIENRLRGLKGDVDTLKQSTMGVGVAAIGGLALLLVILAFVLGRSRGRKKYAFVEVRRG
jgi:hypothetical protein